LWADHCSNPQWRWEQKNQYLIRFTDYPKLIDIIGGAASSPLAIMGEARRNTIFLTPSWNSIPYRLLVHPHKCHVLLNRLWETVIHSYLWQLRRLWWGVSGTSIKKISRNDDSTFI